MSKDSFERLPSDAARDGEFPSVDVERTNERPRITADAGNYYTAFDPGEEHVGVAIILALKEITGRDTTELPKLADYVDPDALESLFNSGQSPVMQTGSVHFHMEDYAISVYSDGKAVISPLDEEKRCNTR